MQLPENHENVVLSVGESSEFTRLTAVFEHVEEHLLDPGLLTRIYSG